MSLKCLVCNYDNLYEAPYNKDGIASDEICPCCGFQYGYDDLGKDKSKVFAEWRTNWINNGYKWFSKGRPMPENWDPQRQIREIVKE